MYKRRSSKEIRIGNIKIGGDAPIVVQSMTKTDTRNVEATSDQIRELADCGCEIVRLAVPDQEAAVALSKIKRNSPLPLIADIHFDYRLALTAIKSNIDGLRLNPGNISDADKVGKIVLAARERAIPIRIGVNAGSLPRSRKKYKSKAEHMVDVTLQQVKFLEDLNFDLIKVSLKAFDIPTTIQAYRLIASRIPYPLHLGITEAGLPASGMIRSAIGIGILLFEGIGDTIRVSLSSHPRQEVAAAWEILKSLNLRQRGVTIISCPTCGRCEVDLIRIAQAVDRETASLNKNIRIAVMGCVVNGPGEAADADIGIACGKGKGVVFKKGNILKTVPEKDLVSCLLHEIRSL
jgi:(E)-4-hydroxy-3-methylbut-2-enyl-diphosphate synthase